MKRDDGFFPEGLRVLVVDDDPCCLALVERMLLECKYTVKTCNRATTALSLLRNNKELFDLVISDVHMPDMDGLQLLEIIALELELPVIMMSANDETEVVMKGIVYGACDYLVKPVRMEELRNIWQHVVRRWNRPHESDEFTELDIPRFNNKRKACDETTTRNSNSVKKARVVWSFELHQQFVKAINRIGLDKAVPKRILEVMNIRGLTRENIASHLQKYRLYLKRLSGVTPEPFPVASFQAYEGSSGGGRMEIHRAVPTSRSETSVFQRNMLQFDAGTVASLTQLQALQQAAHERMMEADALITQTPLPLLQGKLLQGDNVEMGACNCYAPIELLTISSQSRPEVGTNASPADEAMLGSPDDASLASLSRSADSTGSTLLKM